MNIFRSKRSAVLSPVEYLFRLAGLVFGGVMVTFQLGSECYQVIDHGSGFLSRQVLMTARSHFSFEMCNHA